jgi:transcription initiation factor TFIIH subunit 3
MHYLDESTCTSIYLQPIPHIYTLEHDNMAVKEARESIIKVPEHPISIPPSVLLLILDLHPLSWSLLSQPPPPDADPGQGSSSKVAYASLHLDQFISVLMVFLNAVLASSGGNQVVVYGATSGRSYVVYLLMG